jgi:hypothetical protein
MIKRWQWFYLFIYLFIFFFIGKKLLMQSKNYRNMSHIHSYDLCDFLLQFLLYWHKEKIINTWTQRRQLKLLATTYLQVPIKQNISRRQKSMQIRSLESILRSWVDNQFSWKYINSLTLWKIFWDFFLKKMVIPSYNL